MIKAIILVVGGILAALVIFFPITLAMFFKIGFGIAFFAFILNRLCKNDAFRDGINQPLYEALTTIVLLASIVWFFALTLAAAFKHIETLESMYTLSVYVFCLIAALYLNQKTISTFKNLLVGIGAMSCAMMGTAYFLNASSEFGTSNFEVFNSMVSFSMFVRELF